MCSRVAWDLCTRRSFNKERISIWKPWRVLDISMWDGLSQNSGHLHCRTSLWMAKGHSKSQSERFHFLLSTLVSFRFSPTHQPTHRLISAHHIGTKYVIQIWHWDISESKKPPTTCHMLWMSERNVVSGLQATVTTKIYTSTHINTIITTSKKKHPNCLRLIKPNRALFLFSYF